MHELLKKLFGIDYRALALFRILIGLLLIIEILFEQLGDLPGLYTDDGILPRQLIIALSQASYPWRISIHLANGTYFFQLFLLIVQLIFAFSLCIGYRTKLSAFMSWFFIMSLLGRTLVIFNGGDYLLRLLLFWSVFTPMGKVWSIDNLLREKNDNDLELEQNKEKNNDSISFSAGTASLLFQMFLMYFFAGLIKSRETDWISGEAVYYALNIDYLTTPFGNWLAKFPAISEPLSYITICTELGGVILLFSPVFTSFFRYLSIILFLGMQFGFFLCMAPAVGLFPFISSIGIIPFLPSSFWNYLSTFNIKNTIQKILNKAQSNSLVKRIINNLKPVPERTNSFKYKIITNILIVLLMLYSLASNLNVIFPTKVIIPSQLNFVGGILHLDQGWNMFEKPTGFYTFWNVYLAKLKNGEQLDLFQNTKKINWKKPKDLSKYYRNSHWNNLAASVNSTYKDYMPAYLANYLCKNWNDKHKLPEEKMTEIEIYNMSEPPPSEGDLQIPPKIQKSLLYKQKCL